MAGRQTVGRWSNNRWDKQRRDIWLQRDEDGDTWTVEIRVGSLDEPQRKVSWDYTDEATARARVGHCIATGGPGWTEIPEGTGPGGVGWYLGQSA
jgi:hypothetical protein